MTETNWYDSIVTALKNSIEAVFEKKSNKTTSIDSSSTDTQYPSAKCVYDEVDWVYDWATSIFDDKENNYNKTTYLNEYSSDNEYPSAKCVYDELQSKAGIYDIPSQTSDLINNSGFITSSSISGKEDSSNKVSSWSSPTTNTHYPSEKLVKDSLDGKASSTHNHDGTYLKSYTPPTSSTSQAGIVQLEDSVSSTSTTKAATSNAVKTAYDKGNHSHPYASSSHNHDGVYLKEHQSLDSKTVTVEKQTTAETGYISTYVVKQNGSQVGSKINIPKDYLVKSATVNTCSTTGTPTGFTKGDKYIDFVVNTKDSSGTDEHIYLNVNDLVDAYTAGAGLELTNSNEIKHSNSITAQTSAVFKKVKYDAQGHITGTANVDAADLPTHYHSQYLSSHQDISGKEDTSNKVSSWSSTTSDTKYPSEKLVKDSLDGKANSSHTHSNYLTSHQDISGKADKSGYTANKNLVTNSSGQITTENKPTIPTKTSQLTNDSGFLTSHQDISGKADKTGYTASKNLVTNSGGAITTEDKPTIPSKTSQLTNDSGFLTSHQDISGKIDTAGTGLSKSGTTLNHSNSVTAQTTAALKKIKYDAQGHITGVSTVAASDLPSHTHSQYLTSHQSLDSKTVTVEKQTTAESGYAATYVVKQNNTQVGEKINIPKDFLVKSASMKTCTTANSPLTGLAVNDPYLDFVVNTKENDGTDEHIYINVADLVDTYTAGTGLTLSNGSFSVNYGTTSTTACAGNDSRLSNARTPTSHTHGNITNEGAIGSTANKPIITTTSGKLTTGSFGTSANTFCQGNDSRLSDARTPTSHTHTTSEITDFPSSMTPSSHTHGNITNAGAIGSASGKPIITTTSGKLTTGAFGTSSGQFAEGNHTHSNYLTSHQDISGKENTSNKSSSITTDTGSTTKYPTVKAVEDYAQPKGNYLTSHQDISGKIDTAGTGLSKSGTTLNHSNSVTAQTNTVFKKVKYDAQGHITGTDDVTASDLPITQNDKALTNITSLATGWSGIVKYMVKNGWCIVAYEDLKKSSTTSAFDNICQLPYTPASGVVYAGGSADTKVNCNVRVTGGGYLSARCFAANGGQYGSITFPINEG